MYVPSGMKSHKIFSVKRQIFFTSSCLYESSCLVYVVCVLWCQTHIVLCFCFVFLRFVYPVLPVSLDCPYLIAPSVFSNVYLPVSLDCPYLIAPSVFSNVYLPVSLYCPYLIAPSVFSNVYLPVSLDCPYLIAPSVFSNVYYPTIILSFLQFTYPRKNKLDIIFFHGKGL